MDYNNDGNSACPSEECKAMSFDFEAWKAVVLGSFERVSLNNLLEASGLTDVDYLEEDIEYLMRDIDTELDEIARRLNKPD